MGTMGGFDRESLGRLAYPRNSEDVRRGKVGGRGEGGLAVHESTMGEQRDNTIQPGVTCGRNKRLK
jgi:hypothetical protein